MHVLIKLLLSAALVLGGNAAFAALVTWNTTSTGTLNPGSGTACAGTVKCKTTFTSTAGGQTLTAKAYSTPTLYTNVNPTSTAGNWIEAQIAVYGGGGIGVKNMVTGDALESNEPEHAVDNNQIHDVVIFELPAGVWDPESFKLGYANGDSDVQAWVGGAGLAPDFDFRNVCFSGCTGGASTLASLGFNDISTGMPAVVGGTPSPGGASAPSGVNVPTGVAAPFATTKTGRYLVMSGNLGQNGISGFNDAFKISQISAMHSVPVPGSLLLLVLGLALLTFVRARPLARRVAVR